MNTQSLRSHAPLLLALGVPIMFIGVVALFAFLPSAFAKPSYDFVVIDYQWGNQGYDNFSVENGKLRAEITPDEARAKLIESENNDEKWSPERDRWQAISQATIYKYDVALDVADPISFEEASMLTLSDNPVSPDGYRLERGSRSEGMIFPFFFVDNNYGPYYLKKGFASKKVYLQNQDYYYGVEFIGWIVNK